MSDEDRSVPIVLTSLGWEQLPDGTWQLLVECPDLVSYVTLPKTLVIGADELRKEGWDSDRTVAHYRSGATPSTLTTKE